MFVPFIIASHHRRPDDAKKLSVPGIAWFEPIKKNFLRLHRRVSEPEPIEKLESGRSLPHMAK
ncbi:hypothetical protein A0U89_11040 [Kozakia baliensis]|uniref:Uncharacterized protein n=1 Tax=Kozakia baliensis TaxID=153496 RepID=A0A1D8UVH0_9PROT|nr:hypothetical protein A0U89_11040 [Kozakia baliensis]